MTSSSKATISTSNISRAGRPYPHPAQALTSIVEPSDYAIGYSNGCSIIHRALELGAQLRRVVWIAPALERDIEIPPQVRQVDVFYTPHDWTVWFSKFVPFSRWGDMGRVGYTGDDDRVVSHGRPEVRGHGDWSHYPCWQAHEIDKVLEDGNCSRRYRFSLIRRRRQ